MIGSVSFAIVLFIVIGQTVVFSQAKISDNQSKKYLITLKDGSTVQGTIVSENQQEINLATENIGTITIKKGSV